MTKKEEAQEWANAVEAARAASKNFSEKATSALDTDVGVMVNYGVKS